MEVRNAKSGKQRQGRTNNRQKFTGNISIEQLRERLEASGCVAVTFCQRDSHVFKEMRPQRILFFCLGTFLNAGLSRS
jgi:hypothetical protein